MIIINDGDRIQFERGIMEYAWLVEETRRKLFLTIAATKLKEEIRKYKTLPISLLDFCSEIERETIISFRKK
jgi:hypothetical protein